MFSTSALSIWFILLNGYAFALMLMDKRRARGHDWRIPEKRLHLVFFAGGAIGGKIAQSRLRHKTQSRRFGLVLNVLLLLNVLAYGFLAFRFGLRLT